MHDDDNSFDESTVTMARAKRAALNGEEVINKALEKDIKVQSQPHLFLQLDGEACLDMANVLKTLTLRQKQEEARQQNGSNVSNNPNVAAMNRQESSELSHFSQQVEHDRYLGVRLPELNHF